MAKINLEVIDQMFSAVLSANESEATIKALRPQVEEARADLKRAGEKLEKSHPDSESIKHGFRLAFLPA